MDPQIRLLLEVSYEAMIDAGQLNFEIFKSYTINVS